MFKENDLISRSALLEEISKCTIIPDDLYSMGIMAGVDAMKKKVENAPTVDAVPVVRCGECAHSVYKEINDCVIGGCKLFGVALPCDFYCAEGERRNDV